MNIGLKFNIKVQLEFKFDAKLKLLIASNGISNLSQGIENRRFFESLNWSYDSHILLMVGHFQRKVLKDFINFCH